MAVVVGRTAWQLINNFQLGESALGGGYSICRSGGIIWVVAPNTSEVSRTWYCRDDAVTTATACTTATGWFVPTCGQLKNPGYCCRTYWDSYSGTSVFRWSSTENSLSEAWTVRFEIAGGAYSQGKTNIRPVRAFRCVTY